MATHGQPFAWWGPGIDWSALSALSITQLIENGMLDVPLASLLWLFVERKASIIVAALPRLAGKTTTLSALMALRPPQYEMAYTRGQWEDFAFLKATDPSRTYILCNEISSHLPTYLWGDKVHTVFQAMTRGYSLGATMHADSPEQIAAELAEPPVSVTPELFSNLTLVVNLFTGHDRRSILRRVSQVTLVERREGPGLPYAFRPLAAWDPGADSFALDQSPEAVSAVKRRLGLQGELASELRRHQQALDGWIKEGVREFDAVREKAMAFYQGIP